MDFSVFPTSIQKLVYNKSYEYDKVGESKSKVILFDDMVLKIERTYEQSDREYQMTKWLADKLPVPEILAFERKDGFNYLLMTRLNGSMACDHLSADDVDCVIEAFADGLKQLWSVDISNCDFDSRLDYKLKTAKYNLEHHLVDVDDFNEDTLGPDGFDSVDDLYDFLIDNKPDEDLVFSHGDYCMPNVFICGNKATGFLDLGRAGIADRWQDIALCVRSLKYNICDVYGFSDEQFTVFKNKLYDFLNIKEDKAKLRYYILLDELL